MNPISLNGSSFVGQQAGYSADWSTSVAAVNAYYSPLDTFDERFEAFLLAVKALGFSLLDIWTAGQLNWAWALPEHGQIAADLLDQHRITVVSLGGEFGATREELDSACRMAVGVGTRLLSGTLPLLYTDRSLALSLLRDYDLQLALENHPEKTPADMLAKLGDGEGGTLGTCVDTGWYATQGYDVPQAIRELGSTILHVHLKDVLAGYAGGEHVNIGYGKGIVPIVACVDALKEIGYTGDISIENHTTDHDPTPELRDALALVRNHLSASRSA